MARRYHEGASPPPDPRPGHHWFEPSTITWRRWQEGAWAVIADLTASRVKWAMAELQLLRTHFPEEGADGCARRIPGRGAYACEIRARKLGLKGPRPHNALIHRLTPEQVEEVIRLHDVERLGFKPIGKRFGVCEATASNAYYAVMCARCGYRPAARDANGHLMPAEVERLRAFLRKGVRAVDIQLYMGISAGTVCNERRQYAAELKARGKKPLPPPGNGERYSGARLQRGKKAEVEAAYLAGDATPKVARDTGVSLTQCGRIRKRLVRRLARKKQCLPNCDLDGVRRVYVGSRQHISPAQRGEVRRLLLDGTSAQRAALIVGIGGSKAYEIRRALQAELRAQGSDLPPLKRAGRGALAAARRLPPGARWIFFYRILADRHGEDEAIRILRDGIETLGAIARAIGHIIRLRAAARLRTDFDAQLAAVSRGAGLVEVRPIRRAGPERTLGGIATAQI
jgi:hypothetical protein